MRIALQLAALLLALALLHGCGEEATAPARSQPYNVKAVDGEFVPYEESASGDCRTLQMGGWFLFEPDGTYRAEFNRTLEVCANSANQGGAQLSYGTFDVQGDSIYFYPESAEGAFQGSIDGELGGEGFLVIQAPSQQELFLTPIWPYGLGGMSAISRRHFAPDAGKDMPRPSPWAGHGEKLRWQRAVNRMATRSACRPSGRPGYQRLPTAPDIAFTQRALRALGLRHTRPVARSRVWCSHAVRSM